MHRAPLHRRMLPWVFALIFFILAPVVVFYTSGYRYNSKKGMIERNGTMIVDSRPRDVSILLNGTEQADKSPATLQQVAPGTYEIRLEKTGYHSWSKRLEVRPELVTFVDHIEMWKSDEPELLMEGDASAIELSPNRRFLAWMGMSSNESRLTLYDIHSKTTQTYQWDDVEPTGFVSLQWDDRSLAVLIRDEEMRSWIVRRNVDDAPERLPPGRYRFEGNDVIGTDGERRIEYDVRSGAFRQIDFFDGVLDHMDDFELFKNDHGHLSIREIGKDEIEFELPSGDWRFLETVNGHIAIEDGNRWIGFVPSEDFTDATQFPSIERPEQIKREGETVLLSHTSGEIWSTILGQSPDLILRTSEPIHGIAWHERGYHIFYATDKRLVALGLDPRDRRVETTLARFDALKDFTLDREQMFITGAIGGREGVWLLHVE